MNETILAIKNLKKIYHTQNNEILAIENLNLDIKKGEFIAIVGPSGCGKSTLLSIIAKLENKSGGTIKYNKDKMKFGYMFQEDTLFPWLNILDNCLIGLKIQNKLTKENIENTKNLLKKYDLVNFLDKYPSNLSGGMRQRVALIRTLAIEPDILLLDEAFSALDYQTRLKVSDDVWKIIKKEKKTTIMVTHDIGEAIAIADKVIVLSKRPSKIKNIYNIDLKNKSTPINNRKCSNFNYYFDKIWKDIDSSV